MKWKEVQSLRPLVFKRLTGVHLDTFNKMSDVVVEARSVSSHKVAGKKRGPRPKLSVQDELLMLLMYYREYRTFMHISADYGISETQCWRIITELEKLLIKSDLFHLPGKKALIQGNNFDVVLVDVSETPIERPKKNNATITQAKRKGTH